ncbi:MAG: metallophosphoesterase family protein [Lachnospiraceae bacterium]|nr:metallophosphoesterase family protein [Ruminococcus sp.]MCM1273823.1 metallophosphoesterase family protein [Lachnospiraceae bacterium]
MIYYISDLHLGHEKVITYSERPFSSLEEMDRTLIANWRAVVRPDDEVYILGDLIYKAPDPKIYLEQLTGRLHLIKGNHDSYIKNQSCRQFFESVDETKTIADEGRRVFMSHYPHAEWPGYYRNAIHLFGHIHNRDNDACKIMKVLPNNYNVGADCIGFTPRTLSQIINFYGERKPHE